MDGARNNRLYCRATVREVDTDDITALGPVDEERRRCRALDAGAHDVGLGAKAPGCRLAIVSRRAPAIETRGSTESAIAPLSGSGIDERTTESGRPQNCRRECRWIERHPSARVSQIVTDDCRRHRSLATSQPARPSVAAPCRSSAAAAADPRPRPACRRRWRAMRGRIFPPVSASAGRDIARFRVGFAARTDRTVAITCGRSPGVVRRCAAM